MNCTIRNCWQTARVTCHLVKLVKEPTVRSKPDCLPVGNADSLVDYVEGGGFYRSNLRVFYETTALWHDRCCSLSLFELVSVFFLMKHGGLFHYTIKCQNFNIIVKSTCNIHIAENIWQIRWIRCFTALRWPPPMETLLAVSSYGL